MQMARQKLLEVEQARGSTEPLEDCRASVAEPAPGWSGILPPVGFTSSSRPASTAGGYRPTEESTGASRQLVEDMSPPQQQACGRRARIWSKEAPRSSIRIPKEFTDGSSKEDALPTILLGEGLQGPSEGAGGGTTGATPRAAPPSEAPASLSRPRGAAAPTSRRSCGSAAERTVPDAASCEVVSPTTSVRLDQRAARTRADQSLLIELPGHVAAEARVSPAGSGPFLFQGRGTIGSTTLVRVDKPKSEAHRSRPSPRAPRVQPASQALSRSLASEEVGSSGIEVLSGPGFDRQRSGGSSQTEDSLILPARERARQPGFVGRKLAGRYVSS